MLPHLTRLKLLARLLWLYEASGLQHLLRGTGALPGPLRAMEGILPPIKPRYNDYRAPAPALGQPRGDVAFFVGCIQEAFLSPVNRATVRVLQRNGYTVHFPRGQTCCGAAQLHVGDDVLARQLARQNIDAFLGAGYLAVISNAGGCGACLKKDYPRLFASDPVYGERARRFAALVQDISEFLADHLHLAPQGEVRVRATYADSCHLRHAQGISAQPRSLLRQIPGLELVELQYPDRCCGSAGIYNITQSATADAILDLKMADIAATGAELVITSNTGCHMQLLAGVRRAGLKARVTHVVEVLEMSYQRQGGQL
jgi:glycolate oxidase iron-sulfur subunit